MSTSYAPTATPIHEHTNGQPAKPATPGRLLSLDVYRGLIMVSLAFNGFGLARTARNHLEVEPNDSFWQTVRYQFSHVEWVGCAYWDLIQPSFMFMVGVAMAFSYTRRSASGQSYVRMLGHAMFRSLVLIFLGIFLISNGMPSTEWSFMNVLTQIGLGYTFLFLMWGRPLAVQAATAALLLVGTFALYTWEPREGIDLTDGDPEVGISAEWAQEHLADVDPRWHKNANVGHDIDVHLLNQLPQRKPFAFNAGGYQTINFIPSLATMIFGLMAGELLRSSRSAGRKVLLLALAGGAGLVIGYFLDWSGVCPLVKRIWTPSWALFSTGWCCLILATLYGTIDVLGWRRWTFPLVVVGVNSLAIYCMGQLLPSWTAQTYRTHFGASVFRDIGAGIHYLLNPRLTSADYQELGRLYEPTVMAVMVGLVFWLVCLWMYRHKIFIRI